MKSYKNNCLFCQINPNHLVAEDEFCYAAKDSFPVTEFHMLIIPKRHVANYFDLNSLALDKVLLWYVSFIGE